MNIEAVQPLETCDPGLVIQLCDQHYQPTKYAVGYQWKHVRSVIGDLVINQLSDHGITLGSRFGGKGIDFRVLFSSEPDDSYYEVSAKHLCLLNLSPNRITKLLTNHKLFVHDYCEAGFFIKQFIDQYSEFLPLARDITYFHAVDNEHKGNWQVNIPRGHKEISLPICLYGVGTFYQREKFHILPAYNQQDILIPVHKARGWRIDALAVMDEKGLLDYADWSLYKIDPASVSGPNDFKRSPALRDIMHNSECNYDVLNFINKYSWPRMLPQDNIQRFDEHLNLNQQWQNYKRYVGIETHCDKWVISEKSLKGFILGVPSVTISAKNFNSYLNRYGFEIDGDYDSADTLVERTRHATDFMLSSNGNKDIAMHNQLLLKDNQFLSSLIVDPLMKLKKEMALTRQ